MSGYPQKVKYRPLNPEKYVGDLSKIIMRSSWESKLAYWCDTNPNVLKWGSEIKPISYYSRVDRRSRQYYPDFWIKVRSDIGNIKHMIIEVKPHNQVIKPRNSKRKKKETVLAESIRWTRNQDKWSAAVEWAKRNGWEFKIMTEYELGIKKR
jgi:hypothetical protein